MVKDTPFVETLIKIQDGVASAWCQREWDKGNSHCVDGWARVVGESYEIRNFLNSLATDVIEANIKKPKKGFGWLYIGKMGYSPGVAYLNDTSTQEDIILFLSDAIDIAREEGL